MYGDVEVMAARARQLRDQATELRRTADRLVAHAEQVSWSGRAAEAMRERIRERATHLRQVADGHDTAATALMTHAGEVERLADAISEAETKAAARIAGARERAGRTQAPNAADAALAAFEPPPPGHRDWLTVELPGG